MAKVQALKVGRDTIRLDKSGIEALERLQIGEVLEVDMPSASTGTVSMLRTWRMWMAEIANYMAANGSTMPLIPNKPQLGTRPYNADDAHEAFTYLLLGCDDHGQRFSWSMGKGKNTAPKSKRLYAMDKLLHWALEKGITLKMPRNSEYAKLKEIEEG